jgi:hypothetical protein
MTTEVSKPKIKGSFSCSVCHNPAFPQGLGTYRCKQCGATLEVPRMPCPSCNSQNTDIPLEDQVDIAEMGRALGRAGKGVVARGVGAQFGVIGYSVGNEIAKDEAKKARPLVTKQYRMWYRCGDCKKQWGTALQPFHMTDEDVRKCKRKHFLTGILPVIIFLAILAGIFIAAAIATHYEKQQTLERPTTPRTVP